jgi:hypothetical protein
MADETGHFAHEVFLSVMAIYRQLAVAILWILRVVVQSNFLQQGVIPKTPRFHQRGEGSQA